MTNAACREAARIAVLHGSQVYFGRLAWHGRHAMYPTQAREVFAPDHRWRCHGAGT